MLMGFMERVGGRGGEVGGGSQVSEPGEITHRAVTTLLISINCICFEKIYIEVFGHFTLCCNVIDPVRTKNRKRSVSLHETIRDDDF